MSPVPDFVLALREKIGHDPLWLPGVTAVVRRGDQVLLVERADNGRWTPITGIPDPGEEPADAANRELQEEVGYAARRIDHLQTVSLAPGYIQHVTHIHLARDLYEQQAEGDEPEPVEVVPWPLAEAEALLTRPEFSEARAIAAIWLVRRFLATEV